MPRNIIIDLRFKQYNNILQDTSDDNITTTIATTSNDVNIASNISNNPITLNNKKSKSQLSPVKPFFLQKTLNNKQSGQQCLIFISELTISKQILTLAQKTKYALIVDIVLPSHETMKFTIQDAFIVMQKDVQTLLQKVSIARHFATFDITTKILCATTDRAISSSSSITQDFKELGKSVGEGLSILLVDNIVNTISSCIRNLTSSEFLKVAATQMSNKLQKYTDEIYDKIAFIAAILDPCIKLELILADMNTEVNHAIFNNVFRSEYFASILNEFTQYLNEAVLPMSIDLLNWWKLNSTCFPYLSQIAKDYLAIQSTSVPSEQVFFKADDTVHAKCTCLSEKSIQAL
ncbi:31607_t:CDS:2, partial [Gigaspora margarita]